MSPLEDTIVALRPIIPELPWELPNAIRNLSPMMSTGSTQFFNNIDPQGNPTAPIINQLVNFGWEYVYHCHILSHEEMDMMRPVSVAMPPKSSRTGWLPGQPGRRRHEGDADLERQLDRRDVVRGPAQERDGAWADVGTIQTPLDPTANARRPAKYNGHSDVRSTRRSVQARRTSTGSSPRTRSATRMAPAPVGSRT